MLLIFFLSFLCSLSIGMFAIRADRDYCIEEDFMKAVRKVGDSKKLESMYTLLFISFGLIYLLQQN